MSEEFEIGGQTYRAGNIPARTQFHVARRIGPVLVQLLPMAPQLTAPDAGGPDKLMFIATLIEPLSEALAKLSDTDCDYVLDECLAVVQRKHEGGSWTNIWNRQARASQFADIDLSVMMQIVVKVLLSQIGPFTSSNAPSTPEPFQAVSKPQLN